MRPAAVLSDSCERAPGDADFTAMTWSAPREIRDTLVHLGIKIHGARFVDDAFEPASTRDETENWPYFTFERSIDDAAFELAVSICATPAVCDMPLAAFLRMVFKR